MKTLHAVVATLIIIGAINWGLVGAFDFNLVSAIFGVDSWVSNLIYILIGIAGLTAIFTEFAVHRVPAERRVDRAPAGRPVTQP